MQTLLKKSASGKSPKNSALKPKSAASAAKQLSAARGTKPPMSPRHTGSENRTSDTVAAGKEAEYNTVRSIQTPLGENQDFEEFTGRRNRRKKRKKAEREKDELKRGKKKADANKKAKLPRASDKAGTIKL